MILTILVKYCPIFCINVYISVYNFIKAQLIKIKKLKSWKIQISNISEVFCQKD